MELALGYNLGFSGSGFFGAGYSGAGFSRFSSFSGCSYF
jgi:hypothetical protein